MTIKANIIDSKLVKVINTKELQRISEEIQEKIKKLQRTKSKFNNISPRNKNFYNTFYKENKN